VYFQQGIHPTLRGIGERTDAEEGDGRRRWVCGFDNGAADCGYGTADVVLTDILDGPPAGKGLDMLESTADYGV